MTNDKVELTDQEYNKLKRSYRNESYTYALILGGMIPAFTYSMVLKPLNISLPHPVPVTAVLIGSLTGLAYKYYDFNYKEDNDE